MNQAATQLNEDEIREDTQILESQKKTKYDFDIRREDKIKAEMGNFWKEYMTENEIAETTNIAWEKHNNEHIVSDEIEHSYQVREQFPKESIEKSKNKLWKGHNNQKKLNKKNNEINETFEMMERLEKKVLALYPSNNKIFRLKDKHFENEKRVNKLLTEIEIDDFLESKYGQNEAILMNIKYDKMASPSNETFDSHIKEKNRKKSRIQVGKNKNLATYNFQSIVFDSRKKRKHSKLDYIASIASEAARDIANEIINSKDWKTLDAKRKEIDRSQTKYVTKAKTLLKEIGRAESQYGIQEKRTEKGMVDYIGRNIGLKYVSTFVRQRVNLFFKQGEEKIKTNSVTRQPINKEKYNNNPVIKQRQDNNKLSVTDSTPINTYKDHQRVLPTGNVIYFGKK